jgi:peptidoglycan hydrolase CwlO-like protein
MTRTLWLAFLTLALVAPAAAQDIRGLEVCTAEKAMERRTGCLQSNVEFLQQALAKQARDMQAKVDAVTKDAAAQKAEIAALKTEVAKLQHELTELKKPKPEKK